MYATVDVFPKGLLLSEVVEIPYRPGRLTGIYFSPLLLEDSPEADDGSFFPRVPVVSICINDEDPILEGRMPMSGFYQQCNDPDGMRPPLRSFRGLMDGGILLDRESQQGCALRITQMLPCYDGNLEASSRNPVYQPQPFKIIFSSGD